MSISSAKPGADRTRAATEAFARKFTTPEERTEYFRALGQKSAEGRIVLSFSREEAAALDQAYQLLGRIREKAQRTTTEAANAA